MPAQAIYPNAEVILHETEAGFWLDRDASTGESERVSRNIAKAAVTTAPYRKRMRTVRDGEVMPGVSAVLLPGHTPGHTGWLIQSGKESLLIWGDLVHLAAIQVPRPDTGLIYDVDPQAACATRKRMFDRIAADKLEGRRRPPGFPGLRLYRAQRHGFRVRSRRVSGGVRRNRKKRREERMNGFRNVALIAAISTALLLAAPSAQAQERGPLTLAKASYFFVGGKIDTAAEGSPMVGHMYVEYMIPARQRHPYPIVMVHGGSQTGTNFTGTPDGREGWAQYFVRRGYAVYVVDQVARGRSAHWSQLHGAVQPPRFNFAEQRFIAPERFKLWPQAHLHTQWPGTGKAGDPAFDQFYASQFPSIVSFAKQQELNRDALVALLDKIGPAILLTHSQSGAFGWPVADARPNLVKALVAVEPSGPPVHNIENVAGPEWFKDAGATKRSGLGDVPLTYDPPLAGRRQARIRPAGEAGRGDLVRCWRQQEPARKLPNLARIPVVIVVAEASYHAAYDHCTAAYLDQAGVRNTLIRLADVGVRGNGHMMMIEKNNAAIAGVIAQWLDRQRLREKQAGR